MSSGMKCLITTTRNYAKWIPKKWDKDYIKYGLIKYYPRNPNHEDPPITPTKLLMVHRVKPFKGNPYWDKNALIKLGFEERNNHPVVVKNTPEMCKLLWDIKHLIKVTPVYLPDKLPDFNDSQSIYLHENGKVYLSKIDSERLKAHEEYFNSNKQFTRHQMTEYLRLQWDKGLLL